MKDHRAPFVISNFRLGRLSQFIIALRKFVRKLQLFRRVAAALPGMENTAEKPNKDLVEVKLKDTPQENAQQEGGCWC